MQQATAPSHQTFQALGSQTNQQTWPYYSMQTSILPTMIALLDTLDVQQVSVVGHDLGTGLAWGLAFACPERVNKVVTLSVGFPGLYFAAQALQQRAAGWYMPFFLLPGSEAALKADDWALFRLFEEQNATKEQVAAYIHRLSEPGALTAGLNLYRGNFSVQVMGATSPTLSPHKLNKPVLAVYSDKDAFCLEGQMLASKDVVAEDMWRYERVPGGHWFFVEDPDPFNAAGLPAGLRVLNQNFLWLLAASNSVSGLENQHSGILFGSCMTNLSR